MRAPRESKPRPLSVSLSRFTSALAVCGALLAGATAAKAALIWDTNTGTAGPQETAGPFTWNTGEIRFWNNGTNTNVAATSTDVVTFGNSTTLASATMVQTQNQTVAGLIFGPNGTSGYQLIGPSSGAPGGVLTLGSSGIQKNLGSQATIVGATGTAGLSIILGAAQTFQNDSATNLTIGGALNNNGFLLQVQTTNAGQTIFNGGISGTGGFTLNNSAGPVTIGGLGATYSGPTNLNGNTAILTFATASSSLPGGVSGSGGLTINVGAANSVTLGGTVNYTGITTLTSGTLNFTGNATPGTIIGVGSIGINNGANTVTLSGANGYSGATTLTAGKLIISNGGTSSTVSPIGTSTLTLTGGTFDVPAAAPITLLTNNAQTWTAGGSFTFAGSNSLNLGTGAVTLAAGTRTVTVAASNLTVGGLVSGAGSFVKAGAGTLTLSGLSTFTGGITLNAGTLNINEGGNANTNSAIGTGPFVIAGGAIDNSRGASVTLQTTGAQSWNANFAFTGTNSLNLGTGTVALNATRTVTVNNNVLTVGGVISGSGFGLIKAGPGALTLGGANTFTGGVTLSAGTLNINSATALGTAAGTFNIGGGTIDNTTAAANTISANNPQAWNGDFAFTGTSNLSLGTGAVTLGGNRQVTTNAGTLTVGGVIGGAFNLTKAGPGTLALTGANTFGGAGKVVALTAGTLTLGNAASLGAASTGLTIGAGTNLDVTTGVTVTNSYPQTWNGDFTFIGTGGSLVLGPGTVTLGGNRVVTVNANTLTVGGVISGAFGLAKSGAGTMVLTGNSTYSGTTTIKGGVLQLNVGATGTAGRLNSASGLSFTGTGSFIQSNVGETSGSSTQTFAASTLIAGDGSIQLNHATGFNATMTLASLTRSAGAVGLLAVGGAGGGTNGTTAFKMAITSGQAVNTLFVPGIFASVYSAASPGAYSLAFYDTAGFVRELNYASDSVAASSATVAGGSTLGTVDKNVQTTAAITAQSTGQYRSLNIRSAATTDFTLSNGTQILSLGASAGGTGVLLSNGGHTTTISATGGAGAGGITATGTGNELIIRTDATTDTLTLNVPILNTTGAVTKSGTGTLVLNTANAFTGDLAINGGYVVASTDAALGGNATNNIKLFNTASTGVGLRVTGTFATARTVVLNQPTNAIEVSGGNTLTLSNALSVPTVTNGLVKNDAGILTLGGNNSTWTGNITINGGAVRADSNANALGSPVSGNITVVNTSTALQLAGGFSYGKSGGVVTLNSSGINTGGALENVSGNNTWSSLLTVGSASTIGSTLGTLTITGGFSGTQALTLAGAGNIIISSNGLTGTSPASITKIGTGTASLTANSSNYGGNVAVNGGTFVISGNGVQLGGGGTLTVNPNAALTVDDSFGAPSIHLGGRSVTLLSGTFGYTGNTANSTETLGVLTVNQGESTVTSTPAGAGTNNLLFASLAFAADSSVLFNGTNLGTATNRLLFITAPALTGNLLPRAIVTTAGGGFDFATYNTTGALANTNGIQAFANYNATAGSSTNVNSAGAGDALMVTDSTGTNTFSAAAKTINALKFNGTPVAPLSGAGTVLTLTSGGIIGTGLGNSTIDLLNLNLGAQLVAHIDTGSALEIKSILTGSAGLVKADGGTLILSPPASVVPGISANLNFTGNQATAGGTLKLNGGNNTIAPNQFMRISPGATLDLNGNLQYFQGVFTDSAVAAPTVGALGLITSSSGTGTLVINQDNNGRNWAGNITGNVNVVRSGQNTLSIWSDNTYTGTTLINGGTTLLRDNGRISDPGTAAIDINFATLQVDNTIATSTMDLSDRVSDNKPINLRGGTIYYLGRANTVSTETMGALTLAQGASFIRVDNGGASTGQLSSTDLTFGSLTHVGQSSVYFNSPSVLGQVGNNPRIKFTAAPPLTSNLIGAWAIERGVEWASYSATTGEGPLGGTGFAAYDFTGANTFTGYTQLSTSNAKVTGLTTSLITVPAVSNIFTANSLNLVSTGNSGGLSFLSNADTIRLTSGGILHSGNFTASIGNGVGNGRLAAVAGSGTADLYLYNHQSTLTINSAVVDNGVTNKTRLVLWSGGSGTTVLTNPNNTYTGGTTVNGPANTVNLNALTAGTGGNFVIPFASSNAADGLIINGAGNTNTTTTTVQMVNSATVLPQIDPRNIVTLNGNAALRLFGDSTLAGLVLNNTGGGATAPTVTISSRSANLAEKASGKLTIGSSGLTVTSSNVTSTATVTGLLDFGTSLNNITVEPILVNGINANPLQAALRLQAVVGSSGGINKLGEGVMEFTLQTSFTGPLNVKAGSIQYSQTNAGSRLSDVTLDSGTRLNLNGVSTVIGSLAGSGTIINTSGTQTLTVGFNTHGANGAQTFSGSIIRLSDASPGSVNLTKIGTDTLNFTGTGTSIGTLVIQGGTMRYSGSGTTDFASNILQGGGTLILDNAGVPANNRNNRLGGAINGGTLTANGGNLNILGNSAGTVETIGTFTVTNGGSIVTLAADPAATLKFNVGTFSPYSAGGTALFRGLAPTTGTDGGVNPTPGAGVGNFTIPALTLGAPNGAGTGTNGTTTIPIRPDLIGDLSTTGSGTAFITQDTFGGFLRPLSPGNVSDPINFPNEMAETLIIPLQLNGDSTKNYAFQADQKITANAASNSVVLQSGGSITGTLPAAFGLNGGSGSLLTQQVTSGGILGLTGNNGIHVGLITTGLTNGPLFFHAVADMDVTGYLASGSGGLNKAGNGTLTLNSAAFYTGATTINAGTLVLNSGQDYSISVIPTATIPSVSTLNLNNGGTVDLKGSSQAFGPLVVNNVSNTVTTGAGGTVTNSGALATVTFASGGTSSVFSGKLTGALNFVKSGNSTLTLIGAGNDITGTIRIRGGGLSLRDSGTLVNTNGLELYFGALTVDQTGLSPLVEPVRVPASVPVNSQGGTFALQGGNTLDSTASVGKFTLGSGASTITNGTPNTGSGATSVLTIGNLFQTTGAGATVNFTASSGTLGAITLNNPQTFLTQVNGANFTQASLTNKIIGGWAVVNGAEFATYKDGQGVGALGDTATGFSAYDGADLTTGTAAQNINDLNATRSIAASTTVILNALKLTPTATQNITIGSDSTLTLNSGGLLTNANQAINFIAGNAGSAITSGGSELYVFVNQNTTNLGVPVTGGINLVKGGSGTLALTAVNAHGTTIVNQGTLVLNTPNANGTSVVSIPGNLIINNATTTLTTKDQISRTADVTINGGGVLTTTGSNIVNSITFNGTGGNGTPTVATSSVLTVAASNGINSVNDNLSSTPTIAGTSLAFTNATPAITTSGLSPNDLTITSPIHSIGGQLVKSGAGSVVLNPTVAFATATNGATGGSSTITLGTNAGLAVGMNVTGGNITGTVQITDVNANGTDITISAPVGGTGSATPTLTFFGSTFSDANGGFRIDAGTVILAANTTGTVGAVINGPLGKGTLTFNGGSIASDGTIRTIINPVTIAGDAGFGLAGTTAGVSVAGNGVIVASPVTFTSGAHDIAVNGPLNVTTINGALIGTDAVLSKSGNGTLVLTNPANNWATGLPSMTLAVNGGVVRNGASGAIPAGINLSVAAGALFDVAGESSQILRSLSGAGAVTNSGLTSTLYVGGATTNDFATLGNSTFDGSIGDSSILGSASNRLGLTKIGSGTLTLGGTNVYLGATNVLSGTLRVSASGSISGKSAITVTNGAMLEVNGAITAGTNLLQTTTGNQQNGNPTTLRGVGTIGVDTTIQGGTVLSPGNNVATDGTLTFNNRNLTLSEDSTYIFGARADDTMSNHIKLTGSNSTANLDGGTNGWILQLANFGVSNPNGLDFIVIDGDPGALQNVGGGAGDPGTYRILAGNTGWNVSNAYLTFDTFGNDIVLSGVMIPEPNTSLMLFGSLGFAIGLSRFRRRQS